MRPSGSNWSIVPSSAPRCDRRDSDQHGPEPRAVTLHIGTAGWSIPRSLASSFPAEGSALERYASCFAAVEINSSFYRPHRRSTWERWGAAVPRGFRFSVKMPKTISHERKLVDCEEPLALFLDDVTALGPALTVLLLQLPPKLAFHSEATERFFRLCADATSIPIVCEPRHESWFDEEADSLLRSFQIARVAADPAICPAAAAPGGWPSLAYYRLHGSPQIYRSSYDNGRLEAIAASLSSCSPLADRWCIFDNTASGAALGDALTLSTISVGSAFVDEAVRLEQSPTPHRRS